MKRAEMTRERLSGALKLLRTSLNLTQREVAERARRFRGQGYPNLLESQISDYENAKAMPSVDNLVSLLAACSHDGETVDFSRLQRACVTVGRLRSPPPGSDQKGS